THEISYAGSHSHKIYIYKAKDDEGTGGAADDLASKFDPKRGKKMFETESSGRHTHTMSSEGGDKVPHENRPPYYSLAFIIKIA
ncbi:MAG: hypothetical protein MI784_01970, partial [Cytophagales bacterium]|nr:hypothetical protein [Cytophagales bacterium]